MAQQFGTSSLDYFKLTDDKKLYFSDRYNGFVSYRNDNNFAVVLDIPIGPQENLKKLISEFDQFCSKQGLKTAYYRVNQAAMELLTTLKKKHLLIGQEGLCHVIDFSLEGKDKKSLRNAVNNLEKRGYTTEIKTAPQSEELVKELQSISDEWLKEFNKKEIVFAEGKFDSNFIKNQDCIILKDENNSIKAFLNIIPDFAKDECTYDMIRKTKDAPNRAMDLLIFKTIDYTKSKNLRYLNLGMAPLSGIENANNSAEELMKYAYNKVGRFKHYQSLRFFKEKYAQTWNNQYLVYSHDTDLLQLPLTLSTIMKP